MRLIATLFPVAALLLKIILSKPFIVCLAIAVFIGTIIAGCLALKDAIGGGRP